MTAIAIDRRQAAHLIAAAYRHYHRDVDHQGIDLSDAFAAELLQTFRDAGWVIARFAPYARYMRDDEPTMPAGVDGHRLGGR